MPICGLRRLKAPESPVLDVDVVGIARAGGGVELVHVKTKERQFALDDAVLLKDTAEKGFHKNEFSSAKATETLIAKSGSATRTRATACRRKILAGREGKAGPDGSNRRSLGRLEKTAFRVSGTATRRLRLGLFLLRLFDFLPVTVVTFGHNEVGLKFFPAARSALTRDGNRLPQPRRRTTRKSRREKFAGAVPRAI
jgi:hypothetical protein